jgi:hypothetical protein
MYFPSRKVILNALKPHCNYTPIIINKASAVRPLSDGYLRVKPRVVQRYTTSTPVVGD